MVFYGNLHFKGTSGGPRHCIWGPDCPLRLSRYLALDRPTGIYIVKGLRLLDTYGLEISQKSGVFGVFNKHMSSSLQMCTTLCVKYKVNILILGCK